MGDALSVLTVPLLLELLNPFEHCLNWSYQSQFITLQELAHVFRLWPSLSVSGARLVSVTRVYQFFKTMDLFSKWSGQLNLPSTPARRETVGKNVIIQRVFFGAHAKARICAAQHKGHDLITLELAQPYREILLRHHGAKRVATTLPVVTSQEIGDAENYPATFALEWESLGVLSDYCNTPEKVLAAWTNQFTFRTEDEEAQMPGLRMPQIGALHAISAHFAVGKQFEAATVVLPTGTGKTETMLATLIYRRLNRALILIPTDALRTQIAGKFISLGVLPETKVVSPEVAKPRVAILTSGIHSMDEARALIEKANVLITLPNTLEASSPEVVAYIAESCSDLIVDEAHHITAKTWLKIRHFFEEKRILQFTATPFRRDENRIDGKIIFNYKLGDAQLADYYRPISLVPVEEYGDSYERDLSIASKAVEVLKNDREALGLDHLIMARTADRKRAEDVLQIYHKLAPEYKPVVIYSGTGRGKPNAFGKAALFDRSSKGSRIVICVDMLGEGFDLPYLKIAALHDNHKSLAITLQFIGRFTRKGKKGVIGDATVVANIADPALEAKLADLYAEGADWDKIIRRLSEERIEREIKLQDVIAGLKESGDLHAQLSLWNLRPALSVQYFKTSCLDWNPLAYSEVLPAGAETWYSLNKEICVLVAVVHRSASVTWGKFQNVFDTIYDLVILRWDSKAKILSLFASDYNALRSEKMAKSVTVETAELVAGPPIFNVLNNVELPLVKNLGSSRIGAISFTSYFGPNVTEGLASIEKAESSLNNLACLGYENGERVMWGATQRRGKIWQQKSGSISEWIDWTSTTLSKVSAQVDEEHNIVKDFLRPVRMRGPHDSHPISAQWGELAQTRQNDRQFILFGEKEFPVFAIDLNILEDQPDHSILIEVKSTAESSQYRLTINENLEGGYSHDHVEGPKVFFRTGSHEAVPLEEYLRKDPFLIRYVDGTYSYNCYLISSGLNSGMFDRAKLEAWDWIGIPLNDESMHKIGNQNSIQYRTFKELESDYDVIFNDDGCGEAADLVCLKTNDDASIQLCFVHCKGAHKGIVSRDIRNFYVVCGQAQKSIVSKHTGLPQLYQDLKRRHELWQREGYTRFLKGTIKDLALFKEKARRARVEFEMILVQPGASVATITDDALKLLATTELYLLKTTQAKFRVIISA